MFLLCISTATTAAKTFNTNRKFLPPPRTTLHQSKLSRFIGDKTSFFKPNLISAHGEYTPSLTRTVPVEVEPSTLRNRIATSILLALLWTPLCFAGKPVLSLALLFPLIQALREFHYFLDNTEGLGSIGRTVGILSAVATCFTACYDPTLHPLILPLSVVALMLQVLFAKTDLTPTADITAAAFSFMYINYFMSFWIRLLDVKAIAFTMLPEMKIGPFSLTSSSFLLWWTVAIIASADIGGYVVGRGFSSRGAGGRAHALAEWRVAGGKASPRKTVEGLLGGTAFALMTTLLGVYFLRPLLHFHSSSSAGGASPSMALGPVFSLLYGVFLTLLALASDLSVSLWKRHAGVKDSGSLLPGHGGVLDRMDSYLLTGPGVYVWWTLWSRWGARQAAV